MVRVFVIDDNFVIREELANIIKQIGGEKIQVEEVTNEVAFYKNIFSFDIKNTDVFFIDIDLRSYFTGIDLAKKIRQLNSNCAIIFITCFESKGVEVINEHILPLAYLVKSDGFSRLSQEIEKILKIASSITTAKEEHYICLSKRGEDRLVAESTIQYVTSMKGLKMTMRVKCLNSEVMATGSLTNLKNELRSPTFYRELKSYIINMQHVKMIDKIIGVIQFNDNSELTIGKNSARKLSNYLKENKWT